jgi:hypothetical protein
MRTFAVWVTDPMGRGFHRIEVTPGCTCGDLAVQALALIPAAEPLRFYHLGLDAVLPDDASVMAVGLGVRAGDTLFAVLDDWPLVVCRWLAEEALEAAYRRDPANLGSHLIA